MKDNTRHFVLFNTQSFATCSVEFSLDEMIEVSGLFGVTLSNALLMLALEYFRLQKIEYLFYGTISMSKETSFDRKHIENAEVEQKHTCFQRFYQDGIKACDSWYIGLELNSLGGSIRCYKRDIFLKSTMIE